MSTVEKTALLKLGGGQEVTLPEAVARDDALLEEAFPGTTTDSAKGIFRETKSGQMVVHVYTQAAIRAEGQSIPVAVSIAKDDQKVRDSLVLLFGFGANLEITRAMVDGLLVISVVKRAGPKGAAGTVMRLLAAAPEEWNAALHLEWELTALDARDRLDIARLRAMQVRIEAAIEEGERWCARVASAQRLLGSAPGSPIRCIPAGF
jgi:hypothetical protein